MANLFGKDCEPPVYGDELSSREISLRKNYVFVGNDKGVASQVKLDLTKFRLVEGSCGNKTLSLQDLFHHDLLELESDDHPQYVHISLSRTISANHTFTGNPSFSGSPVFTSTPLFSGNPSFTGSPIFTGAVRDKDGSAGLPGQVPVSTADGFRWETPGVENVYWVTKDGDDSYDGKSQGSAKATIKSALEAAYSGMWGVLQDAANLILVNKKFIQDEAFGFLVTEQNLNSWNFPNETAFDDKCKLARQILHLNQQSIADGAVSVVSGLPGYNGGSGKCVRDIKYFIRSVADDLLFGGNANTYKSVSSYFDESGSLIQSIFSTSTEKALMVSALTALKSEIRTALIDPTPGYYEYLKNQSDSLLDQAIYALDNATLGVFPVESMRGEVKKTLYSVRENLAQAVWEQVVSAYPSVATTEQTCQRDLRYVIIALAEDLYKGGNSGIQDCINSYFDDGGLNTPTEREAAVYAFEQLKPRIVTVLSGAEPGPGVYDYFANRANDELLASLITTLSTDSRSSLTDRDSGIRNVSASRCKRDIGYFIDAVATDLKSGGNFQTVSFAEAYYNESGVIYIEGEEDKTAAALNKTRDLMIHAMRNWVTNDSGQVYSPVYSFLTPYQSDSVIIEDWPRCEGVANAINTYTQIVTELLTNPVLRETRVSAKAAKDKIYRNVDAIINAVWTQTTLQYPLLVNTEKTCRRDLAYIVEALAEDVGISSNTNMLEATRAYFNGAGTAILPTTILGEEAPSVFAFNSVGDYINSVLLVGSQFSTSRAEITSLTSILTTAITSGNLSGLPAIDTGVWDTVVPSNKTTIFVRSGVYVEDNPITLPPNTTISGDDLRSVTIKPKNRLLDLFYVNNACKISNCTFSDHLYPSSSVAFPQINGVGTVGIISRSPYIQNCTSITKTGNGMRVDGSLAEGLKSMVLDSFTQYNQGGNGVEILNKGYAQLVSLFTISCDVGVFCSGGGQCDMNNSNASFGTYGLVAEGGSDVEFTGVVLEDILAGSTSFRVGQLNGTKPYGGQILYFGIPYYEVQSLRIINPGSGYNRSPAITIDPPDGPRGIPARVRGEMKDGSLVSSTILRAGRGFTSVPSATVALPDTPGGVRAEVEVVIIPSYYRVASSTDIVDGISTVTVDSPVAYEVESGTSIPFRRQSKILASGVSLEYVGSGTDIEQALPIKNGTGIQENEVDMRNGGSVIFTSTDQSGNFRIGEGVIIDQATGTIGGVAFSRGIFAQITPLILALQ